MILLLCRDLSKAADGECIPITDKEVYIITNPSSNIESTASGSNKVFSYNNNKVIIIHSLGVGGG